MNALKAIVFDCDGVLFESRNANLAYYNAILEQFGAETVSSDDSEKAHLCHTAASPQVLEVLLGPERAGDALAFAATLDYSRFIPYLTPEPGLREALIDLATDFSLAVATNRGCSASELLRHFRLKQFFAAVVTSKDVARPKPWPDMLEEAGRRLGCRPQNMIFIGDSLLDHQAARGAGMRFVAYRQNLNGDFRVNSHRELVALVRGPLNSEASPES